MKTRRTPTYCLHKGSGQAVVRIDGKDREHMIAAGLCRRTINTRIGRLKRVFRWAVSYELLPAPVYEALRAVPGLLRGRGEARDTEPIKPAPEADVRATLPFLPAVV